MSDEFLTSDICSVEGCCNEASVGFPAFGKKLCTYHVDNPPPEYESMIEATRDGDLEPMDY